MTPNEPAGPDFDYPDRSSWSETQSPELVVFDFDGTLVDQRGGWLVLQELFGTRDRGKILSERYHAGEISFEEWCVRNVDLWIERGVTADHVERAAEAVKFTTGTRSLLQTISEHDVPYGTISGGVTNLQDRLLSLEPAFVLGNELLFDEDRYLSGVDPGVGPNAKDEVLSAVCDERGIDLENVFYVGDSHTDVEAFEVAGTAVLFDPDDRLDRSVYEDVDVIVETRDQRCVQQLFESLFA